MTDSDCDFDMSKSENIHHEQVENGHLKETCISDPVSPVRIQSGEDCKTTSPQKMHVSSSIESNSTCEDSKSQLVMLTLTACHA